MSSEMGGYVLYIRNHEKKNMKKDLCGDASLLKKSLWEDLNEQEKLELEKLLENQQLREVYEQLAGNQGRK